MALRITHLDQTVWLHPSGSLYWEERQALLIADLHLGKVTHFRKNGVALPTQAADRDLRRLAEVVDLFTPLNVYFLGDLFHSSLNHEWEAFTEVLDAYSLVHFTLIRGNHDILPEAAYERCRLTVRPNLLLNPYLLTHHPEVSAPAYNIAGHIHPAVRLQGGGRQRLRLPCFLLGKTGALLPAFGRFTGTHVMNPGVDDRVFVISDQDVIEV